MESSVSDIPAGDGKNDNLFYSVDSKAQNYVDWGFPVTNHS